MQFKKALAIGVVIAAGAPAALWAFGSVATQGLKNSGSVVIHEEGQRGPVATDPYGFGSRRIAAISTFANP